MKVITEYLDHQRTFHSRDILLDIVLNRLRESDNHSGINGQGILHLPYQLIFGYFTLPLRFRFKFGVKFNIEKAGGICPVIRTPRLGKDEINLVKTLQFGLHLFGQPHTFVKVDAVWQCGADINRPLIHARNELRTPEHETDDAGAEQKQKYGNRRFAVSAG